MVNRLFSYLPSMETLRTSNEWWHDHEWRDIMCILDPDGWDRENMHFSWYVERISEDEFERRLLISTLTPRKEIDKDEQCNDF